MQATPPVIVARSDDPAVALATFIAQELEHWGFAVKRTEGALDVKLDDGKAVLIRTSTWETGLNQ